MTSFDSSILLGLSKADALRRIAAAGMNSVIAARDRVILDVSIPRLGEVFVDVERDRVVRVREGKS